MSAWAVPGVKCVCIYDGPAVNPITGASTEWGAEKGRVYTIVSTLTKGCGFYLALWGMPLETYHDVQGFRPIITCTQEEDLAVFRTLLESTPVGEDA